MDKISYYCSDSCSESDFSQMSSQSPLHIEQLPFSQPEHKLSDESAPFEESALPKSSSGDVNMRDSSHSECIEIPLEADAVAQMREI